MQHTNKCEPEGDVLAEVCAVADRVVAGSASSSPWYTMRDVRNGEHLRGEPTAVETRAVDSGWAGRRMSAGANSAQEGQNTKSGRRKRDWSVSMAEPIPTLT